MKSRRSLVLALGARRPMSIKVRKARRGPPNQFKDRANLDSDFSPDVRDAFNVLMDACRHKKSIASLLAVAFGSCELACELVLTLLQAV